jgi:hypothetical protein
MNFFRRLFIPTVKAAAIFLLILAGVSAAFGSTDPARDYLATFAPLGGDNAIYSSDTLLRLELDLDGGRSPNGRFEVRIFRDPHSEPSDYAIRIQSAATGRSLFTLDDVGGYLQYPGALERCHALWHSSSQFVAVTDQGTRHSREFYILAVYPKRVERLKVPDYIQNALGRVGVTEVDFACVSTPMRWDQDDLIVQFHFTANNRRSYTCEVVLRIFHSESSLPYLGLTSVSKPTENADSD